MHSDRLPRIIELKERLMEEKERLLDQRSKERDKVLSNIEVLSAEIETNYAELCARCLDGNEFVSIKDYLDHLGRVKEVALNQKEMIEREIAAIRSALYKMFKEIKVLHALNEKRRSAARREENKKHQKLLDEIALRLGTRKP